MIQRPQIFRRRPHGRRPRLFGLFCVAAAVLHAGGVRADSGTPAQRPNLIVILADDLGRGEYSAFGTPELRTPHLDRLCREGVEFRNFYANSCACSPTRAALLTGCYPDRVGVPGVIRHTPANSWGYLSSRATLLPQVLSRAGYHTAIVGKWHLGLTELNTPDRRGFDFFHGFLGDMMDDYWSHLRGGQNYMRRNAEVIGPTGHATDLFTQWACEYLTERAAAGGPFFLYLAYNAPHDPIQPPPEWLQKVVARQPELTAARAGLVAMIEHLDDGVGKVLATLDRLRLAENTLVLFTSDNGGSLRCAANNGPWRAGKLHMYDGGLRVPCFARWPARIRPGSRSEHVGLSMDIFATLCEAAGATPPAGIDGVSFLPALRGEEQPAVKERYFVLREGGDYAGRSIAAVLDGPWKLVHNVPFGGLELYHVGRDPYETTDLAAKERPRLRELRAVLQRQAVEGGRAPFQPPQ